MIDPDAAAPSASDPVRASDDTPADHGGRGRGRAPLVLAVSLAVVFAIAAAVLGVLLAGAGGDDDADELRQVAGRFGEVLLTYDHRDPETHRDAVLRMATGSFREEYEAAFDQGLSQLITEAQATSTGFVKDVFITEIDDERALAIIVADVEHEGTGGSNPLYDIYVRLTMVRVGGEWKVDQVTDLNFNTAGGASGPVTADTTATTATSLP